MSRIKDYMDGLIQSYVAVGETRADKIAEATGVDYSYVCQYLDDIDQFHIDNYGEPKPDDVRSIEFAPGSTLKDVLLKAVVDSPNQIYCIGSASGFFYIGNAQAALYDLPKIFKRYLEDTTKRFDKASNDIPKLKKRHDMKVDELVNRSSDPESTDTELAELGKQIKSLNKRLRTAKIKQKNSADYITKYGPMPLTDRVVSRMYTRCTDDAHIIIVDGTESGRYWFQSEYNITDLDDHSIQFKTNEVRRRGEELA